MATLPLQRRSLYRKAAAAVICALALLAPAARAQLKRSHQLRALAVLELWGSEARPTGARLLPVAILVGDKWYDAASYSATPRPLALDPGTVYEALRRGEPAGFFTIGVARQQKGEWYAAGKWESRAELEAAEKARAARYREQTRTITEDDGPPRLRKPGSPAPPPEPPVSSDDARQDHKKLTPRAEAERVQPVQPDAPLPAHADDPDRPRLRKGAHSSGSQATLDVPAEPAAAATAGPITFIAVSDPDGTGPTRDFGFPWKPEEERALKAKAIALAEAELNKYRAARPGSKPGKASGKRPALKFDRVQAAGFDLFVDNNAELVVTGQAGDTYVTLIARTGLSFEPRTIFASVTDKDHLDAIPRMELVGPVDAEGRGRGELLFRLVFDHGYRWAIFATNRDQAWPLWQSSLFGE